MHPLSIFILEGEQHPWKAVIVSLILAAIALICVLALKWYAKKHPNNGNYSVRYDYSGPKVKVTYGEPKATMKGCGHEGCECPTPCQSCKCHPKDK